MLDVFGKQILKYFDNNIDFEKYQLRFQCYFKISSVYSRN